MTKRNNPLLNIDKIKTRKEILNLINSAIKKCDVIYGGNDYELIKNKLNNSIDSGKKKFYKTYHKTVPETTDIKDVKNTSTVLALKFTIDFEDELFLADEEKENFKNNCIQYFSRDFDLIFGFIHQEKIILLATTIVKKFFHEKKLKEILKLGLEEDDVYGILSYSHILPSSFKNKDGKKEQINGYQLVQYEYYKQVLKPLGFPQKKQEQRNIRLTETEAQEISETIEAKEHEITYLKTQIDNLQSDYNKLFMDFNQLKDIERVNKVDELQLKAITKSENMLQDILTLAINKGLFELNEVYRKYYGEDKVLTKREIVDNSVLDKLRNDNNNLKSELNKVSRDNFILNNTIKVLANNDYYFENLLDDLTENFDRYNPHNLQIASVDSLRKLIPKEPI